MRKGKRSFTCIWMIIVILFLGVWWWWAFFGKNAQNVLPHQKICQLTGKDALIDSSSVDVIGTDLGIIVKYQSQYYYIFGDTFGGDFDSMSNMGMDNQKK